MLEPYYRLSTGKTMKDKVSEVYNQTYRIDSRKRRVLKGTSNALYLDFTSSAVSTLSTGMRKETRATFVWLVAFCTLTVQLSIITNPAFINLSNIVTAILTASAEYGAASCSLTADRSPVPRGMLICWFVLLGCLVCLRGFIHRFSCGIAPQTQAHYATEALHLLIYDLVPL